MDVILLKDIPALGQQGSIVSVKDGYARNLLFPKKLAVEATGTAKRTAERKQARTEASQRKRASGKEALKNISLTFHKKAGPEGRLYGGVSAEEIEKILKQKGFDWIEKKHIHDVPLETIGRHDIKITRDTNVIPITIHIHKEQ